MRWSRNARRLIIASLAMMRRCWRRVVSGKRNVYMLLRHDGKTGKNKRAKEQGQSRSKLHLGKSRKSEIRRQELQEFRRHRKQICVESSARRAEIFIGWI